jgi:hypothetical protein
VHVLEAEHAHADVAADAHVASGHGADVADQRGGGRLAVGAGDRHDLRALVLGRGVHRAGEEFHVAEDLDARVPGAFHGPVWRRVGQRHAGRQHEGGELRPVGLGKVGEREAIGLGGLAGGGLVVPERDLGAAGHKRARGRQPGAGQAEHGDRPTLEAADRDHGVRMASPTAASGWPAREGPA